MDEYNLTRFIEAQEGVYPTALQEVREGYKRSHWMWFIFPQLRGLGHSYYANFYGISGEEEAKAYLKDPVLGPRLREVSEALLEQETDDAREVFGGIDSVKLRSSMTLFDAVAPGSIFARVLDKYFNGQHDNRTINLLKANEVI